MSAMQPLISQINDGTLTLTNIGAMVHSIYRKSHHKNGFIPLVQPINDNIPDVLLGCLSSISLPGLNACISENVWPSLAQDAGDIDTAFSHNVINASELLEITQHAEQSNAGPEWIEYLWQTQYVLRQI